MGSAVSVGSASGGGAALFALLISSLHRPQMLYDLVLLHTSLIMFPD